MSQARARMRLRFCVCAQLAICPRSHAHAHCEWHCGMHPKATLLAELCGLYAGISSARPYAHDTEAHDTGMP
eukprot:2484378-Pleurochrysis_carterae.AAC.1